MRTLYERARSYPESIRQRDAVRTLLGQWGTAYWFVTLRFNHAISYLGAREKLRQFHARLDRLLLGKKWSSSPDRSKFVAVPEKRGGTLHYHLLLRLPSFQRPGVSGPREIDDIWREVVGSGSSCVIEIVSGSDQRRIAEYMSKDAWKDEVIENYVLSTEFVRS